MIKEVPFSDLNSQYLSIKKEIDVAIAAVIKDSAFVGGPYVETFEAEYSSLMGSAHCVSCANGTDALYIAMRALGVKPGDEVITTAHSWISTSETIALAGGNVVFCDTQADSYTIDPADIAQKITSRTVGIVLVHLYGHPAEMDAIMAVAKQHGLWVVEDCAQAHLARYKGKLVGTFGDAATFSFYPGKNLGAMGDAGAVTTNDAVLSEKMIRIARHGGLRKGEHLIEGINSRLDGLQAAILSVKLKYLPDWTQGRVALAQTYTENLASVPGVQVPVVADSVEHVYHLYVIRHQRRDELADYLKERGIQTVRHYPVALPFLPAYQRLDHQPSDFPIAFQGQSEILSLPLFPEMSEEQQGYVIDALQIFA